MAKGTKRKNPGVGVDFKRAKYKVGRKVPKAANDTDVSFKARSIALPSQGIGQVKGTDAVTSKNLTIKELLVQCGHYSERVRKEALTGMMELMTQHPEECSRHAASCMDRLAERMTDASGAVRSALLELFSRGVPAAYPGDALSAFLPLLLAHVRAALTHISEGIRRDGLALLQVLAATLPRQFLGGHLGGVLSQYCALLAYGSHPSAGVGGGAHVRTLASLHKVVASLQRFLACMVSAAREAQSARRAEQHAQASRDGGVLFGSRGGLPPPASEQQLAAAVALLGRLSGARGPRAVADHAGVPVELYLRGTPITGRRRGPLPLPLAAAVPSAAPPPSSAKQAAAQGWMSSSNGGAEGASQAGGLAEAAELLDVRLQACWAECCPAQLSAAPELLQVQCMTLLLQAVLLMGQLLEEEGHQSQEQVRMWLLGTWARRMAPHLPAPLPEVAGPLQQAVALLNKAARPLDAFS